jgi:hypothetical protein
LLESTLMKSTSLYALIFAIGLAHTACERRPQNRAPAFKATSEPVEPTPEQKAFCANRKIYKQGRMSLEAPTLREAATILRQIQESNITDPELLKYIAYCRNVAAFCEVLEIPHESRIGFTCIIKKLNYPTILKHLTDKGSANAPSEAARLASEAFKINSQMLQWVDLEAILSQRYAKEVHSWPSR